MTERVYGLHAVRALLLRAPGRVRQVWLQRGRNDERALEIERLAQQSHRVLERVDVNRLQSFVGEAVHQGVVADIEPLAPWREDDLIAALTAQAATPAGGAAPLILALDGVQDPHNLGACLRTADACGVLAVVVPRDRAATLNPAARKVAAGAAETTPVVTVTNLVRTLGLLKNAGMWIVGAHGEAEKPAHEVDLTGPRCVVMGAEGTGLRELTRRHCDWLVRLPSLGSVESLNVSVATGMLLYECLRQRRTGDVT